MIRPPSPEQLEKAFAASQELNPTPGSWGLFVYSDAPPNVCGAGFGSFHWFRTRSQMLRFVRDFLAWWHPGPSSLEPDDIALRVKTIFDSVDIQDADLGALRKRLNAFMRGLWHIKWWGPFSALCEGKAKFPLSVRKSFLESSEPAAPGTKLAQCQLGMFKDFLREYGV
ncbi:MAG: hypothetical protein ACYC3X_02585 [Pirellulaceae bacterium]